MTDQQLHALALECYNGFPLALVEVRPQRGDLVFGRGESEGTADPWIVRQAVDEICLHRGEPDGWGHRPESASMRHSATCDGLFWCKGGERDGYALQLLTPAEPPGSRKWQVVHLRREPDVVAVDVVSTIEVTGPVYRPRRTS